MTEAQLKSLYHAAIIAEQSHITCPICGVTVLRKSFRNHCRNVHGVNISSGPGRIRLKQKQKQKQKKSVPTPVVAAPVEEVPSWVVSPEEMMDFVVSFLYCDTDTMPIRHLSHLSKFRTHVAELLEALL